MIVLDASALLAFLQGEPGAEEVERALPDGVVGAANWAETAQKVLARGGDWAIARSLLSSCGLRVEPVTTRDAEAAAAMWPAHPQLPLGDRLCLALGSRLDAPILTADRAWGESEAVRQIR